MKNKKGLIILSSVVAVCAVALILSSVIDWPVSFDNAGGNIGKSSRFSRKTAVEPIVNMNELLVSDPSYKDGIVAANVVMLTRSQQYGVLVDMSNEVAGGIPAYSDLLSEMNNLRETVDNVCATLFQASDDINATLIGTSRPDLSQNVINSSLAYTTLQKQNKLADKFIKTTDKYVESAEADERLMFVRDQWVDYQMMSAALDGDKRSMAELEKKGTLLDAEQAVSALGSFEVANQVTLMAAAYISNMVNINNSVLTAIPFKIIENVFSVIGNSATEAIRNVDAETINNSSDVLNSILIGNLVDAANNQELVKAMGWESLNRGPKILDNSASEAISNAQVLFGRPPRKIESNTESGFFGSIISIGSMSEVMNSFGEVSTSIRASAQALNMNEVVLSSQVGEVIRATADGNKAVLNFL